MDDNQLIKFLTGAKTKGYSSGKPYLKGEIAGFKEFLFESGKLKYMDIYSGSILFTGQEIVFENSVPQWGMAYYGAILDDSYGSKEIYDFLRSALSNMPEDLPLRGKESFSNNKFTYKNATEGAIGHFIGYEEIEQSDDIIYELHYSGGYIK